MVKAAASYQCNLEYFQQRGKTSNLAITVDDLKSYLRFVRKKNIARNTTTV